MSDVRPAAVVILAAGEGTRMRSRTPKVLHDLCGRPLIEWPVRAAREAGAGRMELGTSEADTAAIALYESCGFTNRERRPDGPTMLFYEREL